MVLSETDLAEIYRDFNRNAFDFDTFTTYSIEDMRTIVEYMIDTDIGCNFDGDFDNVITLDNCAEIIDLFIEYDLSMDVSESGGNPIGDRAIIIYREDKDILKLRPLLDDGYKFCQRTGNGNIEDHTDLYQQLIKNYSTPNHISFGNKPRRFCDLRIIAADGVAAKAHMGIIFSLPNIDGCLTGETDGDALAKFDISGNRGDYTWRLPAVLDDVGGNHVAAVIDAIYENRLLDDILAEKSDTFKLAAIRFARYLGLEI